MRRTVRLVSLAAATLLLAACNPHTVTGTSSPSGAAAPPARATTGGPAPEGGGPIPLGPGPQATYHVQPQPAAGSCHYRYEQGEPLPDSRCTPGARNPAVTQATIKTTICKPGYTATIRPPASITGREKKLSEKAYETASSSSVTEYDHPPGRVHELRQRLFKIPGGTARVACSMFTSNDSTRRVGCADSP